MEWSLLRILLHEDLQRDSSVELDLARFTNWNLAVDLATRAIDNIAAETPLTDLVTDLTTVHEKLLKWDDGPEGILSLRSMIVSVDSGSTPEGSSSRAK